jgi:hypothetical protein
MRTPGGISAEALKEQHGDDNADGYQLSVFGEHDVDPADLLARLERRVRAEVGRRAAAAGRWAVPLGWSG